MAPNAPKLSDKSIPVNYQYRTPITAPYHSWITSPARSHASSGQGKELPLHLIALILSHLDNVSDLARATRTSRLFYYMTLPRLYEEVTLRSYSDIRYVDGRPEGYGNGSPFAMGLNTLVSRNYTDYVQTFRVVGDWREHDVEDYSKGRVPDNSMMLQVAMRAALDKMKNLNAFAWELNTKPLQTIWQGVINKPSITSLTLRFQTKRIPRPTTLIPPLPNLKTLVVYDIDPLCYPDDISLLLVHATKLENLKMHFNPRMRESGEESVNLVQFFGRCITARVKLRIKRLALYNLYARNSGDGFDNCSDPEAAEEFTIVNCMGSSQDPMTVFLDDTWRLTSKHEVPANLKMMRVDFTDPHHVTMLSRFYGLERMYLVNKKGPRSTCSVSTAATPTTPSLTNTPSMNGTSSATGTPVTEHQCKTLAGDYLAVIQSNHRNMRHLLLSDRWSISEDALSKLFQNCSNLEQIGFAFTVPPLTTLRPLIALVPKLWALRILIRPNSEFIEKMDSIDPDIHQFVLATELWYPEFRNLKYLGLGDKYIYKLGGVVYPQKGANGTIPPGQENSMNARRAGPIRIMKRVDLSEVQDIEIWSMDSTDFDTKWP
ncbi:hypothetical protein B0J11DRAFT_521787 [Dendryphion nanum]|uniref:F-box domain-containing protein n=1 Tax=Dendryphion nanum TaxID=256645 RepID=A0A9P9E7G1_9PLEO|nr:hypothetical protein B0J11DRAFT_521787 [Dendryphion nanum]